MTPIERYAATCRLLVTADHPLNIALNDVLDKALEITTLHARKRGADKKPRARKTPVTAEEALERR